MDNVIVMSVSNSDKKRTRLVTRESLASKWFNCSCKELPLGKARLHPSGHVSQEAEEPSLLP